MAAYRKKDWTEAAQRFSNAVAQDPDYLLARTNLASVHALSGNWEEALTVLKASYARNPAFTRRRMETDDDLRLLSKNPEFQRLRSQ